MTNREAGDLTGRIRALAFGNGAELVGFASAEEMKNGAPKGHKPSDLLRSAKSIITLACGGSLNEDRDYVYHWGPNYSLTYIQLKDEIKWIRRKSKGSMEAVSNLLRQEGWKVVTEPHGWSGILSFKTAAYLGGLGVLGKGNFILHPELGPLNVLACIVTDAPLKYDKPLTVDVCKDCVECIKACKYGAFKKTGNSFAWLGDKCRSYDLIMNPVTLKWTYGPCNSKCVNVCPVGKEE